MTEMPITTGEVAMHQGSAILSSETLPSANSKH